MCLVLFSGWVPIVWALFWCWILQVDSFVEYSNIGWLDKTFDKQIWLCIKNVIGCRTSIQKLRMSSKFFGGEGILTSNDWDYTNVYYSPQISPLSTALNCTELQCTILDFNVLYFTTMYYTSLQCTILHYNLLYFTTLRYFTTLHCSALFYTALHYIAVCYKMGK